MTETREILSNRFSKLAKHFSALRDYHDLIKSLESEKRIYEPRGFSELRIEERAVFDAYLKRFSSIQDYLGTKVFPVISELTGNSTSKMSEILLQMEKEEIIESLESWIALRELRNALEHEYPDELEEALNDLSSCVDRYGILVGCFSRVEDVVKKIFPDFEYETA